MTKGLKQMVAEATEKLAEGMDLPVELITPTPPPVKVSGQAHKALASAIRRWSGWPNAVLHLTPPPDGGSPFGSTEHTKREFHIGVDNLVRNPHRVLHTLTPFRLRQEAVLTGVMLHEAGHARHSRWRPQTAEAYAKFVHGSGSVHEGEPVNVPTLNLATMMEEARIEGLMARNAAKIGAMGLEWTMRAAGAAISPMTVLAADPNQKLMDLITAWTLRAGKQTAVARRTSYELPQWAQDFTTLLHGAIIDHLDALTLPNGPGVAATVIMQLDQMVTATDDTGTFMVDTARDILDTLFPETDPDDCPSPEGGCSAAADGPPQHPLEDEEGGEGSGDGDDEEDEGEGAAGIRASDTEGDEGEGGGAGEQEGEGEQETDTTSALAKALAELESKADYEQAKTTEKEADESSDPTAQAQANGAGSGNTEGKSIGGFRPPTPAERDIRRTAESFLRDMIDPTVTSKVRLSSDPSSTIDAAAYSAWKATGQTTAPHFFRQTKRVVSSSPPVRIAILVDVSISMDVLTKPSALLSWALSSAAYDLRNFAGHGVQVESCLIHWGSAARVIQKNGQLLRGISDHRCREYTTAMYEAFGLVEQEMPGFFDAPEKPSNRLLVHFTDWALGGRTKHEAIAGQARALLNGVNTLSVVPAKYNAMNSDLHSVMKMSQGRTAKCALMKYDPKHPEQVWSKAAEVLS